jgi:hypothetical protein
MDADHDRMIGREDVYKNTATLADHLPGVTPDEFSAFIALADTDNNGKLDDAELLQGLSQGMETALFLETDASADRRGAYCEAHSPAGSGLTDTPLRLRRDREEGALEKSIA